MGHHISSCRDPGLSDGATDDDQSSSAIFNTPPPSQSGSAGNGYKETEDTLTTLINTENFPAADAWRKVQDDIRRRAIITDAHPDWTVGDNEDLSQCTLKFVGGADVSYNGKRAVAALVVLNFQSMEVVEERVKYAAVDIDYVSQYLGFREAPLIVGLLQDLMVQRPEVRPQVLVVDGNGRFHPRRCGLACHIGVLVNIPAFGVAKKCMRVDRYNCHLIQDLANKYLNE